MTLSEFRTLTFGFLDVDANRRGIEILRDRLFRAAIADLKHFIPQFHDGVAKYSDNDRVPFDDGVVHQASDAVAMFIKYHLVRATEKDLSLAVSYWRDYIRIRLWLYREAKSLSLQMTSFSGEPITAFDGSILYLL